MVSHLAFNLLTAFSVSVNVEPDILVIDETLAVGDAAFQFKYIDRLERLTRSGVTILFVSHDLSTVKAFCNHTIYLDQGMIKAAGKAEEVAEVYLLDLKNAQKQAVSKGPPVTLKPAAGSGKGIAFGTEEGRVTSAVFTDTNGVRSAYKRGDRVKVRVGVEFIDRCINRFTSHRIRYLVQIKHTELCNLCCTDLDHLNA